MPLKEQVYTACRKGWVDAVTEQHAGNPTTRCTDVALYTCKPAPAVTVMNQGTELPAATISDISTNAAEDIASTLAATTNSKYITVITDSQVSCYNYQLGHMSTFTLKILQTIPQLPGISIVWTPGHESLNRNEAARAAA